MMITQEEDENDDNKEVNQNDQAEEIPNQSLDEDKEALLSPSSSPSQISPLSPESLPLLCQLQQQKEEIQQLKYELDSARKDAETSTEMLSCVMEAVQILTTQMKRSHYDISIDESTTTTVPTPPTPPTLPIPAITTTFSDLTGDFSRTKAYSIDEEDGAGVEAESEEEEEENEDDTEEDEGDDGNYKSTSSCHSFRRDVDVTPKKGNDKHNHHHHYHFNNLQQQPSYKSSGSVASSSVATFMSKDNKRFSKLLELTSTSQNDFFESSDNFLSHIRSGLISLGHSCQMVGENANFLHNEASTFLVDLQDANCKLSELQQKYQKTEKVAKKLYKNNNKLEVELNKCKIKRNFLVKELKILLDEKEMRKEYEDHLLKAWDIHERMINFPKKMSLDDIEEGDSSHGNSNSTSVSSQLKGNKEKDEIEIYNDDFPITKLCSISNSTGITPPASVGFEEMLNNCPTMESSTCEKIPPITTSSSTASKPSWLSLLTPTALQLTPTASVVDTADSAKPTICSKDLHFFDDDDNDDSDMNKNTNNNKKQPKLNAQIKLLKSNSSSDSLSTPKSQNSVKKSFFSSKKNATVQPKKTSIYVKLPVTGLPKNHDLRSPLSLAATSSSDNNAKNLPPPVKVVKRKNTKKQYKQYKLGE